MKRRSPAYERAVARALRSRKFRNIQYVEVLRRTDSRGDNGSRRKRKYVTMRIPESVAMRVHTRLSAKAQPVKVESARARPFPQTY
jgi:hypothetical protein